MSTPCAQCGKTVFFAEKQSYDGKDFHGICMQSYKKNQKTTLSGHTVGFSSYPSKDSQSGGAKFCGNCGTKGESGGFCGSCGQKLEN